MLIISKIISFFKNNKYKVLGFIILWVYTAFVFWMQSISCDIQMSLIFAIGLIVFSANLSLCIIYLFNRFCNLGFIERTYSKKKYIILCIVVFLLTLSFYIFYFAALYPGGLSSDTVDQLTQAYSAKYNDWHPVLHTLLFFTLPIKLGGSFEHIVLFQIILFCLAFTYLIYILFFNNCPKIFLLIICIYIWINPFIATYLMYPWKDIGLTIFAIILLAFYIQIVLSKGQWLNKKSNIVAFAIIVTICTYMRHNAILFTIPLILLVLFYAPKKKLKILLIISIFVSYLSVRVLYFCLDVENPDKRILETVGLPVTIWSNVMQKNSDSLPVDMQEVMYQIASKNIYENQYVSGSFNSIKYTTGVDTTIIDNMSYSQVIYYTLQCFKYAPKESIEAFSKLTNLVWGLSSKDSPMKVEILENQWGITTSVVPFANTIFSYMQNFFSLGIFKVIFGSYGFMNFIMLIVGVSLLTKNRISIIHLIPLFCYNFGTMLLLSGRDTRFFLLNILLWLPTIFLMFKDNSSWNALKK